MKIGFPNHPRKALLDEIKWIGENQFDFVDLFLEPDCAHVEAVDCAEVRRLIDAYDLDLVGHTAWYLPIGSPIRELRDKAVEILKRYLLTFSEIHCEKVTVHGNWPPSLFTPDEGIKYQSESLRRLSSFSSELGIRILYEPIGTRHDNRRNIKEILARNSEIDFHADIGHLNLFDRNPLEYVTLFKDRLRHIHMHDNDGQRDLHLPIGTGSIDWESLIRKLRTFYDGSVTLEVFSKDRDYVLLSRDKLREMWQRL
jgi:sugar phosphate isomerase/epimerase